MKNASKKAKLGKKASKPYWVAVRASQRNQKKQNLKRMSHTVVLGLGGVVKGRGWSVAVHDNQNLLSVATQSTLERN